MKIVHINTYDHGGAAIACIKQHQGLIKAGIDSWLITREKTNKDIDQHIGFKEVVEGPKIYSLVKNSLRKLVCDYDAIKKIVQPHIGYYSFIDTIYDLSTIAQIKNADVINLHWAADFIDWPSFFKRINKKRIVWTLHDLGPFTGGYHYSGGSKGYEENDSDFPALSNTKYKNITKKALNRKKNILENNNIKMHIVAGSDWLNRCSQRSRLFAKFPTRTIYCGFDQDLFTIKDKNKVRSSLQLPLNKRIILFVSQNIKIKRKGFQQLIKSFEYLPKRLKETLYFCSVGEGEHHLNRWAEENYRSFGRINEPEVLTKIYSAADLFVIPSIEEAFGQTAVESLLCGVPVVGFAAGGIKEIIKSGFNGYLSEQFHALQLGQIITYALENRDKLDKRAIRSDAINRFRQELNTRSYIELYTEMMNSK